jgi:hypothetical protein
MRKNVFAFPLLIILIITACNKESHSNLPGSWTYAQQTYDAFDCVGYPASNFLVASNDFPPNPDSLFFYFNAYPVTNGSYVIVNSQHPAAGQVGILFSAGKAPATLYVPTALVNAQASITVSAGKVSISTPVFQMANEGTPQDSASFIAVVHQTQ